MKFRFSASAFFGEEGKTHAMLEITLLNTRRLNGSEPPVDRFVYSVVTIERFIYRRCRSDHASET